MPGSTHFLNLADFERAARRRLPSYLFGFIAGASEDGHALRDARAALDELHWRPRVLRSTAQRHTRVEVFGSEWAAPFGIAPMGAAAVAGYRADLALAQAAAVEQVPFVLSGASLVRMEKVAQVNPAAWFQIYASQTPEENVRLLERARDCGISTLVVTVDVPVGGNREDDLRNGYTSPLRPTPGLAFGALRRPQWLLGTFLRTLWTDGMPHFENFPGDRAPMISATAMRTHRRDSMDWETLGALRDLWPGKMVLKGVLAVEDARLAREAGVDGVIVSSHGGRQQSCAVGPARVLPEIAAEAGAMQVFCDGSLRRGGDVAKVVALGASLAFIGRPMLYAAAVGGVEGVRQAIRIVKQELSRDLALLGAPDLRSLPALARTR
jgi:L-lactate dehydrogenase (cytochrome)